MPRVWPRRSWGTWRGSGAAPRPRNCCGAWPEPPWLGASDPSEALVSGAKGGVWGPEAGGRLEGPGKYRKCWVVLFFLVLIRTPVRSEMNLLYWMYISNFAGWEKGKWKRRRGGKYLDGSKKRWSWLFLGLKIQKPDHQMG